MDAGNLSGTCKRVHLFCGPRRARIPQSQLGDAGIVDYLLSGSINNSVIGPMPQGLSNQQRTALKEILTTIQDNLSEWEKDQ